MRQSYYKTKQTRFPQSTFQKCGFRQSRWTRVNFKSPQQKQGDFEAAKNSARKNARRIIEDETSLFVWVDSFGIHHAIWTEGHDPTDKYGDYLYRG